MADRKSEGKKTAKKSVRGEVFDFCEVCVLNHDHGRRHKYLRSHQRALFALLSRFRSRILDVKFFIKSPSKLRPEHSPLNRMWCPFCSTDLRELDSPFVCGNAIKHLSSEEHTRNTMDFLWKHGAGTDQADSLRFSDTDLLKWEKGCKSFDAVSSSSKEASIGPSLSKSKDIQFETTSNNRDVLENNVVSHLSTVSSSVLPLQSITNEKDQSSNQEDNEAHPIRPTQYFSTSAQFSISANEGKKKLQVFCTTTSSSSAGVADSFNVGFQALLCGRSTILPVSQSQCTGVDTRTTSRMDLTRDGSQANVHTGAPPPWLDSGEEHSKSAVNKGMGENGLPFSTVPKGKFKKLNPKRVGAAWAEKRKFELEMERRGERVESHIDANWLPNFGRVWQEGTRKESKKEFERETRKIFKADDCSSTLSALQPYISKRQRPSFENDKEVISKGENTQEQKPVT